MRIGKLSEKSGLSRDTIRFYERNGLVSSQESKSSTNKYRDYSEENLERLAMIREAQIAGFSIAELVYLFRSMESPDFGSMQDEFDADDFLDRKIGQVREQITRATSFLEVLQATKQALNVEKL